MNVYLFRIENSSKYLKKEIENNRLRQGWGTRDLNLLDSSRNIVLYDKWVENYKWDDKDSYKKGKYRNLIKMTEMNIGDFIIVPKYPEWNQFTIFKINETYKYDLDEEISDFGHIIGIDYDSRKTFHYQANEKSKLIHSKLRGYQSAINAIINNETKNAVKELYLKESDIEPKDISDIIKTSFFKDFDYFNNKLGNSRPNDIEKIVEKIFIKAGYKLERNNYYDKKGGDADLIFSKHLEIMSDFYEDENIYQLYIQVKKRNGEDWNEYEGIEQLEQITTELDSPFYSKLLVSTGEFSDQLKETAKNKNINLIDGKELVKLILKYL